LLNDIISIIALEACKFDPFSKEPRSYLHSVLQVKPVVLGATENWEQELRNSHLVAALIFEYHSHDEEADKVKDNDEKRSPVVACILHADYNSDD
jgi:hypothetical protein